MWGLCDRVGLDFSQMGRYSGAGFDFRVGFDKREILGGLNTNYYSQLCQLCYLPEFAKKDENDVKTLAWTPPVYNLKLKNIFNIYDPKNGDLSIEGLPFGAYYESTQKAFSYFYDGKNEGVMFVSLYCDKAIVDKGVGQNSNTFDVFEYDLSFEYATSVIKLGKNLEFIEQKIYENLNYPYAKVSDFYDRNFIINYDDDGSFEILLIGEKSLISLTKGKINFLDFYFSSYKYLILADYKNIVVFNKTKMVAFMIETNGFKDLKFNPALKTLTILNNDDEYVIYSLLNGNQSFKSKILNNKIAYNFIDWAGNLTYDFIKSDTSRGHYPQTYFNFAFDAELGPNYKGFSHSLLGNFDDCDIGKKEFLSGRKKLSKIPHDFKTDISHYIRTFRNYKQLIFVENEKDDIRFFVFDYI